MYNTCMKKTKRNNFAFTEEAARLLTELSQRLGVSKTSVLELAIRAFAAGYAAAAKEKPE